MNGWMEWMDGWMDGWIDGIDGWMDGWTDGWMPINGYTCVLTCEPQS